LEERKFIIEAIKEICGEEPITAIHHKGLWLILLKCNAHKVKVLEVKEKDYKGAHISFFVPNHNKILRAYMLNIFIDLEELWDALVSQWGEIIVNVKRVLDSEGRPIPPVLIEVKSMPKKMFFIFQEAKFNVRVNYTPKDRRTPKKKLEYTNSSSEDEGKDEALDEDQDKALDEYQPEKRIPNTPLKAGTTVYVPIEGSTPALSPQFAAAMVGRDGRLSFPQVPLTPTLNTLDRPQRANSGHPPERFSPSSSEGKQPDQFSKKKKKKKKK